MDRVVYPDKSVIQAARQVVPLKLDVDRKDVAPVAAKYGVNAIPAVFVMDATGKVVGTIEFTMSPTKFASEIRRILKSNGGGGRQHASAH